MWGVFTLGDTMFFPSAVLIALFAQPELPVKMVPLANRIGASLSTLFPEGPAILPLPADASPVLPSVVFQREGVGRLTVARSRLDLILQIEGKDSWQGTLLNTTEQLASCLMQTESDIGRVGLVLTYACADFITIDHIRDNYLRVGKASGAQAINVAWLNKTHWKDMPVNQWIKYVCSSGLAGERSLMIDVNTPSDTFISFDPHLVREYVSYWVGGLGEKLGDIVEW